MLAARVRLRAGGLGQALPQQRLAHLGDGAAGAQRGKPQGIRTEYRRGQARHLGGHRRIPSSPAAAAGHYIAAYGGYADKGRRDRARKLQRVQKIFANVPVFDGGGRAATTTFVQRKRRRRCCWPPSSEGRPDPRGIRRQIFEIYRALDGAGRAAGGPWWTRWSTKGTRKKVAEAYLKWPLTGSARRSPRYYRPRARAAPPVLAKLALIDAFTGRVGGWLKAQRRISRRRDLRPDPWPTGAK